MLKIILAVAITALLAACAGYPNPPCTQANQQLCPPTPDPAHMVKP